MNLFEGFVGVDDLDEGDMMGCNGIVVVFIEEMVDVRYLMSDVCGFSEEYDVVVWVKIVVIGVGVFESGVYC